MIRYQLVKATRRIRILLGGGKEKEAEHKMFLLFNPDEETVKIEWLGELLRKSNYYYNVASTTYKKQIYTARRIIDYNHQIHLRFYSDGWVTGHSELRPEIHPLEHLEGVDCTPLDWGQTHAVADIFNGIGWKWPRGSEPG